MFEELILTIDTAEKDMSRVAAITEFFENNGAVVVKESLKESSARKESLDYRIEGIYKENNIDLVIEFKTLQDFANSWQELEDRLFRALQAHTHVALVIEHGSYGLTNINTTRCMFRNPAVPDGSADVLPLAVYDAKLEEWMLQGVHVRLINTHAQFPTTVLNLLNFITKPDHGGLRLKGTDFRVKMLNLYSQFDGVGIKTAEKLFSAFPNMYFLCSYAEEHLVKCIGAKKGHELWQFLHNQELITSIWKGARRAETDLWIDTLKPQEKQTISHPGQSSAKLELSGNGILELIKDYIRKRGIVSLAETVAHFKTEGYSENAVFMIAMSLKENKDSDYNAYKDKGTMMLSYIGLKASKDIDIGV